MTLQNFGISSTPLPSNPNLKEKYGTDMKCPRVITNHTNQRDHKKILLLMVEGNFLLRQFFDKHFSVWNFVYMAGVG